MSTYQKVMNAVVESYSDMDRLFEQMIKVIIARIKNGTGIKTQKFAIQDGMVCFELLRRFREQGFTALSYMSKQGFRLQIDISSSAIPPSLMAKLEDDPVDRLFQQMLKMSIAELKNGSGIICCIFDLEDSTLCIQLLRRFQEQGFTACGFVFDQNCFLQVAMPSPSIPPVRLLLPPPVQDPQGPVWRPFKPPRYDLDDLLDFYPFIPSKLIDIMIQDLKLEIIRLLLEVMSSVENDLSVPESFFLTLRSQPMFNPMTLSERPARPLRSLAGKRYAYFLPNMEEVRR